MEKNEIFHANETPQMLDAYNKARSTFKYFWRELGWERRRIVPALDLACVKAKFQQESSSEFPIVEHMWLDDISFDGIHVSGCLLNNPNELTNIKQGDYVEIPLCEISDWMFATNGKTYGGFTVQALRAAMDNDEREAHDNAWGLDFGDFDKIQVVYEQDEHPENIIEHPMSINMAPSLKEFLAQHPDEVTKKDDRGFTMLHRETIAGNKSCVEILLQMGADINAKTNSGHKASDFAKMLEWEHLAPIL